MSAFDVICEEAEASGPIGSPRDLPSHTVAERLGRQLTPVVIDLSAAQPRFASYLDWDESSRRLLLVPIAGADLARSLPACHAPIRIRSSDPAEPWMLVARRVRVIDDRMATIELMRGQAVRMPARFPGRTQATGREPLVLAVHAGPDAIEGHVFPVTSLGASHCLIDATLPLDRGQELGPVEVIGERRILRRAVARVIEVIPWITPHGHRRFRCRLSLDDATGAARDGEPNDHRGDAGYDLLSDAERVHHVLDLGGMLGLRGWYDAPGWRRNRMRMGEIRDGLLAIQADDVALPDAIPLPSEVRIGFELFAVSYEGWARLHRRRGDRLELALPYVLRRRRRRREQRALVPPGRGVTVVFRNAATGEVVRRPVRDLSFGGLSFVADDSDLFWRGAYLERARLEWDDQRVALGELEVRALTRAEGAAGGPRSRGPGVGVCHVANRGVGPAQHAGFIGLLASLYHPEAERHDGAGFAAMVALYERVGLLGDFMLRNLQPVIPGATDAWRRLHDARANIACTLLFRGSSTEPQAAFSAVRVWEKTWLLQHFGALPGAERRAAGTLQLAYLDFVMPQRNAHYLAFFVRAGNGPMNAFHERFFELTGTPEAVTRVSIARWLLRRDRPGAAAPAPAETSLRPLDPSDEVVVSRAAERAFGSMPASALSLVPGAFALPQTSRRFGRLGLTRAREVSVIPDGAGAIDAALIKERTSPGVNLTWMLDAWWFLPVEAYRTGHETAIAAAAAAVAGAAPAVPGGDKMLIVPDKTPSGPLLAAGFEKLTDLHLYVINRSGFRRYHEHLADRYGELDAKMIKRSAARLSRSAS